MQQQQQQSGFTLIELIIVIVILGILAVTAAPKFIDIQGDATASTLKGVRAALQGGSQLVYAKSAIASNQRDATGNIVIGGQTVPTIYGYPSASVTSTNIAGWVDIGTDFQLVNGSGGNADGVSPASGSFAITPVNGNTEDDYSANAQSCHVLYTQSSGLGVAPVITVVTNGC
jgi:MSHA pilin protein MshA